MTPYPSILVIVKSALWSVYLEGSEALYSTIYCNSFDFFYFHKYHLSKDVPSI